MEKVKYFMGRGSTKGIDEETDAYSDGEDEQDTPQRKRENRETVQVVKAEAASLRARAASKAEFKGATMSKELTIDTVTSKTEPRVAFEVEGLTRFTDKTLDAARNLDYNARTTAYQTRASSRGRGGIEHDTQRTMISFDIKAVIEEYFASKQYAKFAIGGSISVIVFLLIAWHAVSLLYSYL